MCHQRSSTIGKKKNPPPLTYHHSCTILFGKGPEKQSSWPCTTASHYQSHLRTFVFAFSFPPLHLSSISSPFNCLCLFLSPPLFCPHCVLLSASSFLFFPPCFLFLYLIIAHSFLPLSSLVSLPPSSPPHGENVQSCSLKSQPNLHYPTSSFYPLITHSTLLA